MIRFIGMYFMIGIVVFIGAAFFIAIRMYKICKGDEELYWEVFDALSAKFHLYENSSFHKKVDDLFSGNADTKAKKQYFINFIINVALWPMTTAMVLNMIPEGKQYIKERTNSIQERE